MGKKHQKTAKKPIRGLLEQPEDETSFIHRNRNYIIAFLIIIFLSVLLVFYNIRAGLLVPEGSTAAGGAQVGLSISTPPQSAIENQNREAAIYRSQEISKRHDYGLFETELKSVGWFERDGTKVFRADIWVHNTGDNSETFMWEKAKIRQVPNKEYIVTSGLFNGTDIPSGGEREGYLLFADVPEGISGDVIVVIGHSVGFSTVLGFTSQAPHQFDITLN